MATVTEKVKESLVGTEVEPQLSSQTRSYFTSHAKKDDEGEEYYMGEDEFVDAIAPEGEDYVSTFLSFCFGLWRRAAAAAATTAEQHGRAQQHAADRASARTYAEATNGMDAPSIIESMRTPSGLYAVRISRQM